MTPGWVSDDAFLAGYGAAQAVPGPLFTFSAYLGAVMILPHGLPARDQPDRHFPAWHPGADGHIAILGNLPAARGAQAIMRGVNAAVVGLLGARLQSGLDEFR